MEIPLLLAAFVFIVFKTAFGFLGWYSKAGNDQLYRDRLDELWDTLHRMQFYELAHRGLQRLVLRVHETLPSRGKTLCIAGGVFLVINFASFVIGGEILLAIMLENYYLGSGFAVLADEWGADGYILIGFGIAALGTLFDFGSLLITWSLLKHAAQALKLSAIGIHIVLDIFVALAAVAWSLAGFMFVVESQNAGSILGFADISELAIPYMNLISELASFPEEFNPLWAFCVTLGLSASIPTIAHLLIAAVLLLAKIIPDRLRGVVRRLVYLITVDDKPVLGQLGTVAGVVAGLLAGLAGLLSEFGAGT